MKRFIVLLSLVLHVGVYIGISLYVKADYQMSVAGLLAAQAALSLAQMEYGIYQTSKANRLASKNKRTEQEIQPEYRTNLSIAERMARQGLAPEQYNNAMGNINRNTGIGIRTLQNTGQRSSLAGGIAGLVDRRNVATRKLDTADAAARNENERLAMTYRKMVGDAEESAYQENAAAIRGLKGACTQNMIGGVDRIGSSLMSDQIYGGGNGMNLSQLGYTNKMR
jgi:hypothetical protein